MISDRDFSVRAKYASRSPVDDHVSQGTVTQRPPGVDDVLEPFVLVEAGRQLANDRAVLPRHQDDVAFAVAPIAGEDRQQVAGGRRLRGVDAAVRRLLRIRSEVAAIVGRPLLVAERLEAILEVLVELLIEFVGGDLERLLVGVLAAPNHRLAQREEVAAETVFAPLGFDELEDRVAQVVDHPRAADVAVAFEPAHLRNDVGHGSIAHSHQILRAPLAGHVVGQTLMDPQRRPAPHERGGDDVVVELVRQLVHDEPVEQIRRFVHGHDDALARRFGERADAFLRGAGNDVLLLELAARLKQDQRHLVGEVVLQLRADVLVGALRIPGHPLEVRLDFRVVVHDEVIRLVRVPGEFVVADLVLAEVRDIRGLGRGRLHGQGERRRERDSDRHPAKADHVTFSLQGPALPDSARAPADTGGRAAILLLTQQQSQSEDCAGGSKGCTDELGRNGLQILASAARLSYES